ncbi:hypothetical protein PPSIR1_35942 [Plesiocystis pacifica SIR-1]|uniref:Uncharacterized protein n=1 Tax=Plesiocystis pacifica SIR-1 TaxID=391625 RepID=A6G1W7_9BACT|nr:hypothetical protein [Plesiocystis pacifica]EDM80157.1 hypothetical protein PPSIR1_35942 [Plesiocystis pacifica SIR-1]
MPPNKGKKRAGKQKRKDSLTVDTSQSATTLDVPNTPPNTPVLQLVQPQPVQPQPLTIVVTPPPEDNPNEPPIDQAQAEFALELANAEALALRAALQPVVGSVDAEHPVGDQPTRLGATTADRRGLRSIAEDAADTAFAELMDAAEQAETYERFVEIVMDRVTKEEAQILLNSVSAQVRDGQWTRMINLADVYRQNVPRVTDRNLRTVLANQPKLLRRLDRWTELTPYDLEQYTTQEAIDVLDNLTWQEMSEANARTNEVQRFGVEMELNGTKISYGGASSAFRRFAGARGHKGIMKHPVLPVEVHLDHLSQSAAKIELVINPPQAEADIPGLLLQVRTQLLNKKADGTWLDQFQWSPEVPQSMRDYIARELKGNTGISGQPVQVTTTHTAKELQRVVPKTKERFMAARYRPGRGLPSKSLSPKDLVNVPPEQVDDFMIAGYLGRITPLKQRINEGKGSSAMVKHAAEQFTRYEQGVRLSPDRVIDRIRKKDRGLNRLHTYANKPAPVFKRPNGDIAYVIEYRSGSHIGRFVSDFLQSNSDSTLALASEFNKYV